MSRHVVGTVQEIPPGQRKIVEIEGKSIGVFNVGGRFYALKNVCPHKGAPICAGRVSGTTLPSRTGEFLYGHEGEIVRCPWHGWEFNITNGKSIFDPNRCYVATYEVEVEEAADDPTLETYPVEIQSGNVIVHL